MGIEVIGLAIAGAGFLQQRSQAKKAERAQVEGQAIQTAGQKVQDLRSRRANARQERIRRARLVQASTIGGTANSSAEIGALSAIGANSGAAVAGQRGAQLTAQGLTAASQREARAINSAKSFAAFTKFAQSGLDLYEEATP